MSAVTAAGESSGARIARSACRRATVPRAAAAYNPFVRLSRAIRKHRNGILAAIRLNTNNARLVTRRAYGFHAADAALALIMLTCGPITLMLPHEETHLHV